MVVEELVDAQLVRNIAARAEDARAAEALLCRRFAPRIRLYGLRHLKDEDRARDLVQSALVSLLEAARSGRIEDVENVHRFVLGICRNTVLRMRETDGRTTSVPHEELAELATVPPEAEKIELSGLLTCFDKLDPRAREIVMLSFHEGKDAQEIATLTKTTAGNVRVVRHRAVAALRRCLEGAS